MEDILASIRRIIADDQTQGVRSGYGASRRTGALLASSDAENAGGGADAGIPGGDSRTNDEDVLDLAHLQRTSAKESAVSAYAEQFIVPNGAEQPGAQQPEETFEAPVAGDLYSSTEETGTPMPQQSTDYRNARERPSSFRGRRNDQQPAQVEHTPVHEAEYGLEQDAGTTLPAEEAAEESGALGEPLISPMLGASVMSAFETLAGTVVLQNTEMLERTMRELLRPLVKTWLDDNLPTLVERLVRSEIERVARGGRG